MSSEHNEKELIKKALLQIKSLKCKVDAFDDAKSEPIAVVGIGCHFPNDVYDTDSFWSFLEKGGDGITEIPLDRWDFNDYFDSDPDAPGKMYTRHGGFVSDIDKFDPAFFGISPREAESLDPQQRLLTEVSWEALENAGYTSEQIKETKTGIFIGICTNDYSQIIHDIDFEEINAYMASGNAYSMAAGRLSYILGVQGPCMSLDTSCSSSLVSVHLACKSLRDKESNFAIAGGVNGILYPAVNIHLSKARMLAADGCCKTFDEKADGYVRGEGCGVVVLKRLSDAIKDNDNIISLIRGSASNHDGRTSGLTVPNGPSQQKVIKAALENSNVNQEDISYIEAHGTGTSLGDPIEIGALSAVFKQSHSKESPLRVGSVKTNIGHLEGAAGIAGLIKTCLCLKHEAIVPHLHFKTPNPLIDWDESPIIIPTELTPWKRSEKSRLAGVSSFGFSGTNAHVILEEAPFNIEEKNTTIVDREQHLLTLSAKSEKALKDLVEKYIHYFNESNSTDSLGDISYTSHVGRSHFNHRMSVVGGSKKQWVERLDDYLNTNDQENYGIVTKQSKIAFLYTGQGSQYPDMCKELFDTEQVFRNSLFNSEEILKQDLECSLTEVLYGDQQDKLNQTQYTQPALFAIEMALTELWKSWGIQPDYVMGHSLGEYVAACQRGVMTVEEGLKLVSARGRLMQALPNKGSMLSALGNENTITDVIKNINGLEISAFNAPGNLVISGEQTLLNKAEEVLTQAGIKCKALNVAAAFHSSLVEPMLEDFSRVLEEIDFLPARKGFVSNVTGRETNEEVSQKNYWLKHIREAVNYRAGINSLVAAGVTTFIEIGPQPVLLGLARQSLEVENSRWLPSVRQNINNHKVIMDSLAELYIDGSTINWQAVDQSYNRKKTPLPTYAFQRERYWVTEKPNRLKHKQHNQGHPLLGEEIKLAQNNKQDTWFSQSINANQPSYLNDHKVYGQVIYPAAGYVEMALAAGKALFKSDALHIENLRLLNALFLTEDKEIQTLTRATDDGYYEFEIYSQQVDDWVIHASGIIKNELIEKSSDANTLELLRTRIIKPKSIDELYEKYTNIGIDYGVNFQTIEELTGGDGESLAHIRLPLGRHQDAANYLFHPTLLDGAFQSLLGGNDDISLDNTYIPVGIESLKYSGAQLRKVWCHAVLDNINEQDNKIFCNLTIFDEAGLVVLEVNGLTLKKISEQDYSSTKAQSLYDHFYHTDWLRQDDNNAIIENDDGYYFIYANESKISSSLKHKIIADYNNSILIDANNNDAQEQIIERLSQNGNCKGVVYLAASSVDDGLDALKRKSEKSCQQLLALVQTLLSQKTMPQLWVVTQQALQVEKTDQLEGIVHSQLWGMSKVIALEHPELNCKRIDIDGSDSVTISDYLYKELQSTSHEDQIAYRAGKRYVARLSAFNSLANTPLSHPTSSSYRLDIIERGTLDNIYLKSIERCVPESHEVEIHIKAAALNFRDVLNALGMYPGDPGLLGGECAGEVLAVGSNVSHLKVGDKVLGIAPGSFGSYVTVDANMIAKMADCLSYEQAAAVPIVYLTTHYTLNHIAKLKAGEKILIHAATGGVGQAAVQLAHKAGAEIYATASIGKWDVLDKLGVKHKMNSRSLDFVDEINKKTSDEGVDLVLNSLSGEYIERTVSVIKDQGRFIEIGKRDIWTEEEMAERAPQLQYNLVDLVEVCEQDPALIQSMLNELMAWFDAGELVPPQPTEFDLSDYLDAFRYMQQAKHTGKIVLRIPETQTAISVKENSSYIITGGLGGLGRLVTQWLIDKGAGHVVLLSRGKADEEAQLFIDAYQGCVSVTTCDVANSEQLDAVIQQAESNHGELKGVIHAAGVLSDGVIQQQDWQKYETVFESKVWGTWNLHESTKDKSLDFFVLFSSMASLVGSPGQSNYAAANNYMDQFAAWRKAQGYPALSINWGPWGEVGMAAEQRTNTQVHWASQGIYVIDPSNCEAYFDALFLEPNLNAQIGVLDINWLKFTENDVSSTSRNFLEYFTQLDDMEVGRASWVEEVLQNESQDKLPLLIMQVKKVLANVLNISDFEAIGLRERFFDLGIDSLMAVELSNKLKKDLRYQMPATLLFDYPTIEALTNYIADDILQLQQTNKSEDDELLDEDIIDLFSELDEMSDDDATQRLV